MGLLIDPHSLGKEVRPANGKYFTYDELSKIVDGTIAIIEVDQGLMYYNDNFVAEKFFYNMTATEILRKAGWGKDNWMAGTVIVVPSGEQEPDDDDDDPDNDHDMGALRDASGGRK